MEDLFDTKEIFKTYIADIKNQVRVEVAEEMLMKSLVKLMNVDYTLEQAMDILDVPESDRQKYEEIIKRQRKERQLNKSK